MDTKTRRMSLVLEQPATVLVSVGQPITAGTVIARGQLLDAPVVLPLSHALQSSPAEAVGLLTKKVGDPVQLNEVIATRAAFLATKTVRSPIAGIVLGIDFTRGEVALLSTGEPSELRAPVAGTVVEVKPGRGIALEYAAAELAGVGLGAPASGRITIVSDAAEPIADALSLGNVEGAIIVGGWIDGPQLQVLRRAGAAGIVVGGITGDGWQEAARARGLGLAVLSGFGRLGLRRDVFELVSANYGGPAAILPSFGQIGRDSAVRLSVQPAVRVAPPVDLPTAWGAIQIGDTVLVRGASGRGRSGAVREVVPLGWNVDGRGYDTLVVEVESEAIRVPALNARVLAPGAK